MPSGAGAGRAGLGAGLGLCCWGCGRLNLGSCSCLGPWGTEYLGIRGHVFLQQHFIPVPRTCSPWTPRTGDWGPLLGDFLPGGAGQCLRSPLLSPLATSSFQSIPEPFPGSHFTSYFYLLNAGTHLSAHQTPNHPSKPMGTKALSTQYSLSENTPCKDCPECPFISVGLLGGPPI